MNSRAWTLACSAHFRAPSHVSERKVRHLLARAQDDTRIIRISQLSAGILPVLACCLLLGGCRPKEGAARPSIEFIRVPIAEANRADRLDIIQGRVTGARQGQQLVLYARAGAWWLQPIANAPFTKIQPDSSWVNSTHLGAEYAALLVEPDYHPPVMLSALPDVGDKVAAVATAKGAASEPSPTLKFSDYEWRIRNAPSNRGDTMNLYDPSNAWTDESGALHLR